MSKAITLIITIFIIVLLLDIAIHFKPIWIELKSILEDILSIDDEDK